MAGGKEDATVARPPTEMEALSRVLLRPMVTVLEGTEVPMLGIEPPITTRLSAKQPAATGSPAEKTEPALQGSDRVVAVNGRSIQDGYQLASPWPPRRPDL